MRTLGDSPHSSRYHVISRVVDRRFVLQDREREVFRQLLFRQAAFAGVTVAAWCFMSNHFHLLIEVPNKEKALEGWDDEAYLERLNLLNSESYTRQVLAQVKMWKRNGNTKAVHRAAMAVQARVFDLSAFVKELKVQVLGLVQPAEREAGDAVGGAVSQRAAGRRRGGSLLCGVYRSEPRASGTVREPRRLSVVQLCGRRLPETRSREGGWRERGVSSAGQTGWRVSIGCFCSGGVRGMPVGKPLTAV